MDHFGIGAAMRAMMTMYSRTARQSGRTTSLLESVKDGDRVVFTDTKQAGHFERKCKQRGVSVECIVVPVRQLDRLYERGSSEGRTIFDHAWVEAFYARCIDQAAEAIDKMERETSGFGEPHRKTALAARELSRWDEFTPGASDHGN